jgi:2-oxoisovalerate dehydrogenase E2 component (dihydrolipoyl transacylase)
VIRLPDIGEGIAEAELVRWLVAVGDAVTPDSSLAEVLTDKANVEIACPVSGTIVALYGEPGDVLAVGGDLVVVELNAPVAAAVTTGPSATGNRTPSGPDVSTEAATGLREALGDPTEARRPRAAPAVRREARSRGIDLGGVRGSGPGGRILRSDLEAALAPADTSAGRDRDERPVTGIRRRIAEHLSTAWQAPHITYVDEVDVTEVERLRQAVNSRSTAPGERLTPLAFIARAVVLACADHPQMNAHVEKGLSRHECGWLGPAGDRRSLVKQGDSGLVGG